LKVKANSCLFRKTIRLETPVGGDEILQVQNASLNLSLLMHWLVSRVFVLLSPWLLREVERCWAVEVSSSLCTEGTSFRGRLVTSRQRREWLCGLWTSGSAAQEAEGVSLIVMK